MRCPPPTTTSSSSRTASRACPVRRAPFALPAPTATASCPRPGVGRCEVICFSSDHTGSFAELEPPHARLVVDAWRHRTADLMAHAGHRAGVLLREPRRGDRRDADPSARPDLRLPLSDAADRGDAASRRATIASATAATCLPTCWRAEVADGSRDHRAHRPVHRVRTVRGALAGRGAHLPEQVRAQPR